MADQRSLNLQIASYKGVEFRIREESLDSVGRKLALHEYPNSTSRFVEDLGEIPDIISVTAFVHTELFLDNAISLDFVLREEGSGVLVLPVLGTFSNVYCLPFTKKASQTTVGLIEYDLTFAVGRDVAGPTRALTVFQDVVDKGGIFRDLVRLDLTQLWVLASDAVSLINSARDLETLTRNALKVLSNYIGNDSLAKVLRVVARIENNPGNLIQSASNLAAALFDNSDAQTGFWGQIALSLPNGDGLEPCIDITSTGSGTDLIAEEEAQPGSSSANDTRYDPNIPLWPADTDQRIKRNKNRLSLVNSFRLGALGVAYEQASLREYDTAQQVQEVREKLEEAYNRLTSVSLKDPDSMQGQSGNSQGLINLRNATLEVLAQKEQNASTIEELTNLANYSAYHLSYQLYKEILNDEDDLLERTLVIRQLNTNAKNAMTLKGSVSVLKS